jgi:predicted ATPase
MKQAARHQRAGLLTLDPLPEDSVTQMIVSMTGSKELGKSIGNWLFNSSGGNPYFVEETLKHLVDCGVLRQEADRWILEEQAAGFEVPGRSGRTATRVGHVPAAPGGCRLDLCDCDQ